MSMDYTYIEQLLERYFAAETTREEEHILREFFAQADVPSGLKAYAPMFRAETRLSSACLDESFDERLLALTGGEHVLARRITLRQRLRPMLRVAAMVAVVAAIGSALEHAAGNGADGKGAPAQTAAAVDSDYELFEPAPLNKRSAEAIATADTIQLLR